MGKIVNDSNADDAVANYPGVADVNREGVAIAVAMLCELESGEVVDTESYVRIAELSQLQNWPREGKPFRNVVHEYLARAREGGPDLEAGFCAVLSDLVSQVSEGTCPSAEFYEGLFAIESDDKEVPHG